MGDDDNLTSGEKAEKSHQNQANIYRTVDKVSGGDGQQAEDHINVALGRNILREELGYFGPWDGAVYNLDDETRDRLIAHSRQDIATTYAMAQSAFREAHEAMRVSVRAVWLLWLLLAMNALVLFSLWFLFSPSG